ncbi:MAG: DUF3857 domain-containing protein [Pseudomonadota bacterium]
MIKFYVSGFLALWLVMAAGAQGLDSSIKQIGSVENQVQITAPPGWVDPQEAVSPDEAQFSAYRGKKRLLFDSQSYVDGENSATYYRRVEELLSPRAVQNSGSLRLRYDPTYREVHIHAFNIIRDGQVIDALSEAYLEDMRDEKRLSSNVFEGRRVVYVRVEDLRQGDIIDYSYSYVGENPAWKGTISLSHSANYNYPVERLHVKMDWPSEIPVTARLGEEPIAVKEELGRSSYTYGPKPVARQRPEMGAPRGFTAYTRLKVSSFDDWGAVNDIARPFFETPEDDDALNSLIETIKTNHESFDDRMLAAIRFVQDDLRYQAIVLGLGGWAPNDPNIILARRFGDCKDKSLLLTRLARALGADEAHVALVSTSQGSYLPNTLPSPSVFNHAITYIKHDGQEYWVDGTQNLTGGTWGMLTPPNFKYALILAEGQTELSPMPIASLETPGIHVKTVFDASRGAEFGVTVEGYATLKGPYANGTRARTHANGKDMLAEGLQNSLQKEFGEVDDVIVSSFEDDRAANTVVYDWSTELLDPFQLPLDDDEAVLEFTYELSWPLTIASQWSRRNRTLPLDITEGVHFRVTRETILPPGTEVNLDPSVRAPLSIQSDAFDFERTVSVKDNVVVSDVRIRTKADYVAPEAAKSVFRDIRALERVSDITLNVPIEDAVL